MKLLAAVALVASLAYSPSAQALTHYLTKQWTSKSGDNMCEYDNGTVLNMGYKICPLSI